MAISYNPEDARGSWNPGEYQAILMSVEDKMSKAGNEMQVWTFEMYDTEGGKRLQREYVTAKAAYKIKQLANALGRLDDFKAGTFQADGNEGATLILRISIDPTNDEYNRIDGYLPYEPVAPTPAPVRPSVSAPRAGVVSTLKDKARVQPRTVPANEPDHFDPDDINF
jgi:hypothetical protein